MDRSVHCFSMVPFIGDKQTEIGSSIRLISIEKLRGSGNRFRGFKLRMPRIAGLQFQEPAERKRKYASASLSTLTPAATAQGQASARTYRFEGVQVEEWAAYRDDVLVTMEF